MSDHQRQACLGAVDERGGAVDHGTNGCVACPDDLVAGDDRTQPVGEVDDLKAGDAREEVFVAAGKADHLVREDRSADDELVIIQK